VTTLDDRPAHHTLMRCNAHVLNAQNARHPEKEYPASGDEQNLTGLTA